ncbi:hypothetical protein [Rhodopirellula baltica]|uniref:hypothetical protein n=1 Tax=Rhodopirellula baltica TaxID=265606 RepID=UPI00068A6943|nr:hypothetical protein [Rhodopirellula baltica]
MFRFTLVAFLVVLGTACRGDEPVVSKREKLAGRVASLVVDGWRRDVEAATQNVIESDLPKAMQKRLESSEGEFKNSFDWKQVETYVADEYLAKFDNVELEEIHAFYSSATGGRFLAEQTDLKNKVLRRVALAKLELPLILRTKSNVSNVVDGATGPLKRLLEDAIQSPPISPEHLVGTWYTDDMDEQGNGYRGWHKKSLSGANTLHGVQINHASKEFMSFSDEGVWVLQGKLLAETNFNYAEESQLIVIESVTADELKYRFVELNAEPSEWPLIVDTKKEITLPEKPTGYKDPFE